MTQEAVHNGHRLEDDEFDDLREAFSAALQDTAAGLFTEDESFELEATLTEIVDRWPRSGYLYAAAPAMLAALEAVVYSDELVDIISPEIDAAIRAILAEIDGAPAPAESEA